MSDRDELDRARLAIRTANRRISEELRALDQALPEGLNVAGLDVNLERTDHVHAGGVVNTITEIWVAVDVRVRSALPGD